MSEKMSMNERAEQMMTPEQAELSEVRQRHIAANPEIAKLPGDFSGYTGIKSPTTGFLKGVISGTFDGKEVYVCRNSFGEGEPWRYYSSIEGDLEDPEVKFNELEFVTNAFVKMRTEEKEVERSHKMRRGREERDRIEQAKIDEANRIKGLEAQGFNNILEQLGENLKVLDQIPEEDKDIIISALKKLASGRVKADGELGLGYSTVLYLGSYRKGYESEEQYLRVKTALLSLLGIARDAKPKRWGGGLYGYLHSETYETIIPGVIVRESYNHQETGRDTTGNRAVLRIEDNPSHDKLRWAVSSPW